MILPRATPLPRPPSQREKASPRLRVALNILDRLEEVLIAPLMAAATLLIFVAVVHRYGTGIAFLYPYLIQIHLSWAQELCFYMFVWMAKFGAAYGVRTGIHVGVDVLVNRLPEEWRKKMVLLALGNATDRNP